MSLGPREIVCPASVLALAQLSEVAVFMRPKARDRQLVNHAPVRAGCVVEGH